MTQETKRVVVTLKNGVNVDAFIKEVSGYGNISPNVPKREVVIHNLKPSSRRNVDFLMTDEEVSELLNDPRVQACRVGSKEENGFIAATTSTPTTQLTYTRGNVYQATGNSDINWGLFDSSYTDNPFTQNPISNVSSPYTLDGTGVDIVIQDTGIQLDHPEFQGVTGNTRVQMINWLGGASNISNVSWGGIGNRIVTFKHETKTTAIPVGANVSIYNFYTPNSLSSANITNIGLLNIGNVTVSSSNANATIVIYPSDLNFANIDSANIIPGIIGYFPNGSVTGLANFYVDQNGHGTSVASIAAGKTYGWAPNANIYVMNILGTLSDGSPDPTARISGSGITDYGFDLIGAWHQSKPVDPITGWRRPTVVNMSWTIDGPQLCYYNEANVVVNPMSGNYAYFANTVNYQGTVANLTAGPIPIGNVAAYQAYGLFPQSSTNISTQLVTGILSLTGTVDSVDADAADCINNGVILVGAAGDQSYKIDIPSGSDYNNYITVDVKNASNNAYVRTNRYYYHRGSSPTALNTAESAFLPDGNANSYHTMDADVVCVGAIDYTYRGNGLYFVANATAKANFSCTGPRVDIFAAGGYVAGALSTIYTANLTNGYGTKYPVTNYYANASYKQMKLSGTSQAAPQVTGVLATVLQANPYYTQLDVQNWITEQSATDKIANIGGTTTNPYTELYNLQGANNTYLYNPYQSPEPLTIDGSISITGGSISS